MSNKITIRVRDFTTVPGARHRTDGDGSADEFYEDYAKESIEQAVEENKSIILDFDGTWSYPSSFTSQLAMLIKTNYSPDYIREHLDITANDEPGMVERFWFEYEKDY